jgi:hypothetical protein
MLFEKKKKFWEEMKHNEKSQSIQDHYVGGRIKVFFKKCKAQGQGHYQNKDMQTKSGAQAQFQ